MAGTIYSGTYFSGIVLSNAATQNPATIAFGCSVGNTGVLPPHNGDAIYDTAGTAWNVSNYGTIASSSGNSYTVGIERAGGGRARKPAHDQTL